MIRHTALFNFDNNASVEKIDEMIALEKDLSGIGSIVWGNNFSERANGHTQAISIAFADRDALDAFSGNPAHKRVAETLIKPITADLLIVEYEEESSLENGGKASAGKDRP